LPNVLLGVTQDGTKKQRKHPKQPPRNGERGENMRCSMSNRCSEEAPAIRTGPAKPVPPTKIQKASEKNRKWSGWERPAQRPFQGDIRSEAKKFPKKKEKDSTQKTSDPDRRSGNKTPDRVLRPHGNLKEPVCGQLRGGVLGKIPPDKRSQRYGD